ncbi:pih1d1 [Scenedesmus sp. PABB004]|nr:pih1d1 [Scenedesmus sp. PABB004]
MDPATLPDMDPQEAAEMLKLLQSYAESGRTGLGDIPEDLMAMLENVKRAQGQPTADAEDAAESITPEPGFVVKTTDQDGRKIFINMCHSKQVPAPGGWTDGRMPDSVAAALQDLARDAPAGGGASAEALRFPLSCSEVLPDADRGGAPCGTVDCVVHSDVLAAAAAHRPLKAFLIELALGWVGSKHGLRLDPRFKLPKMAYKGAAVRTQRVRAAPRALVTDVTSAADDAPSFPLLPARPKAAAAMAPAAGGGRGRGGGSGGSGSGGAAAAAAPGAGAAPSSDAAPGAGAGPSSSWPHEVACEGRPVTRMVVVLQLPPKKQQQQQHAGGAWEPGDVVAEVWGQQLRVRLAAQPGPCVVALPFAGSPAGADAALAAPARGGGAQRLTVRLPYLPVADWVAALADAAPRAFAELPVAHADYMELDEPL